MRSGFRDEPLTWYISQPGKCGAETSQCLRASSDVRTNAPLRVPTRTRTPDMGTRGREKGPADEGDRVQRGGTARGNTISRSGRSANVAAHADTTAFTPMLTAG